MTKPLLVLLAVPLLASAGMAQAQAQPAAQAPAAGAAGAARAAAVERSFEETVKEYDRIEGLFTLYRKKKGAADSVLMEVPQRALGKLYLVQATLSTGTSGVESARMFPGAPLADLPFRPQVVDDSRVQFMMPVTSHRAPDDPAMRRTLERAFPETILGSFEIKARRDGTLLVDVTDFFKSDIAGAGARFGQGPGSYGFDRSSTYLDSLKSFPQNLVVRTMYRMNRVGPGEPRSFPLAISYNLSQLPEDGYQPRISDARVGYFLDSYSDQSRPDSKDQNVNFIKRWRLEKADPNAALSPPKKPIKFWIDNGVPEKYRSAVRAGLLMYNAAFEEIGIKDAIQVEQMPDDADWDIADVRYNIIRWTTGNPFAIALFRSNPLTGEILNAAINMDATFVTTGGRTFDTFADPRKYFTQFSDPTAHRDEKVEHCSYPREAAADRQFGLTALELLAEPGVPFDKEAYIQQYVTEVVAHEMGHCLGLRHNFIASRQFTLAQLGNADLVKRSGTAASVMDYLPWNIAALKKPGVPYFSPAVGSYDRFAIRYGYMPIAAGSPQEELPVLRQLASRGSTPGLQYHSDRVADAFDPHIARFDFTADPLEFVEQTMQISRGLLQTLHERKPKDGESYYEYTRSFNNLLNRYYSVVAYTTRYVGGVHFGNSYKGDPGGKLPLVPVSGVEQQRALSLLSRFVFSESAFKLPKAGLAMLAPDPDNLGMEVGASDRSFPVLDSVANFQATALRAVFTPATLARIANNEFRSARPQDTLTLAQLYRTVGTAVWSELSNGQEIGPLRRNLQRAHLDHLISTATAPAAGTPRDATALAWEQLRSLHARLTQALPKAKGDYARPHLAESKMRIERALKATPAVAP